MKLSIDLSVKFRAWFITFGTVTRHYDVALPFAVPGAQAGVLKAIDDRGVKLTLALVPA